MVDRATESLLQKADFTAYLEERAQQIAPRDVEVLLVDAEHARERALAESAPRIGQQMVLALELLKDHDSGECPQIPFYTISLLAEAVYYYLDPNDVIPDWIPGIGKLDDALVMEIAFELGADGIRRYCVWKGVDAESLLTPSNQAARPAAPSRKAPAKKRPAKKAPAKKRTAKKASGKKRTAKKAATKAKPKKAAKKKASKKSAPKKKATKKKAAKKKSAARSTAKRSGRR